METTIYWGYIGDYIGDYYIVLLLPYCLLDVEALCALLRFRRIV